MRDFKNVFFDLDGTLVDNYTAIWKTFCEVFEKYGFPKPTYDAVFNSVGGSIITTARRLLPDISLQQAQQLCQLYMRVNEKYVFDGLKSMPYAVEILDSLNLKKINCVCFTNKHFDATMTILRHLNIARFFCNVSATTLNSPRKPDRAFSEAALEKVGASAEMSLFVGDSVFDYKAAMSVGSNCALVATGSDCTAFLKENCPNALGVYANLKELALDIFGVEL